MESPWSVTDSSRLGRGEEEMRVYPLTLVIPLSGISLHRVLTAILSDLFRPPACHFQGHMGASGYVEQA